MKIIGRKREIRELDHYVETGKSEFIVVYGRRRVGKHSLLLESARSIIDTCQKHRRYIFQGKGKTLEQIQ